jgi:Nucleoside-diphosphate-sugar epimerases
LGVIKKPAIFNLAFNKKNPDPSRSWAPFRIFNIGNSTSIKLTKFISILEEELGIKAIKLFKELEPGDVISTKADTNSIEKWIGYKPKTSLKKGIKIFVNWYRNFYI